LVIDRFSAGQRLVTRPVGMTASSGSACCCWRSARGSSRRRERRWSERWRRRWRRPWSGSPSARCRRSPPASVAPSCWSPSAAMSSSSGSRWRP